MLQPEPEGGFTATIAEYGGAISYGKDEAEATANVLEALSELMEYHRDQAVRATPAARLVAA